MHAPIHIKFSRWCTVQYTSNSSDDARSNTHQILQMMHMHGPIYIKFFGWWTVQYTSNSSRDAHAGPVHIRFFRWCTVQYTSDSSDDARSNTHQILQTMHGPINIKFFRWCTVQYTSKNVLYGLASEVFVIFYVAMLSESAHRSIGGYWMNVNGIRYGDETNTHINICEYIII